MAVRKQVAMWLATAWLGVALLIGCKDKAPVAEGPAKTPYRKDELALLKIATDNIQAMEAAKQYGRIYDQYASKTLRDTITRRRFLMMTNCVEQELGDLVDYEEGSDFTRRSENGQALDMTRRTVRRTLEGKMREEFDFISTGAEYQLNGIYWITANKGFLDCIQNISSRQEKHAIKQQVEQKPEDAAVRLGTSGKQKPSDATPSPEEASPPAQEPAPAEVPTPESPSPSSDENTSD